MNVSKGTKLIETIKSILIVVLFLFTILLLTLFWGSKPFQTLIGDEIQAAEAMALHETFQPDRIEVCFGGDSYTVIREGFSVMADCFRTFSANKNLSIEEIAAERYAEVMEQPSIKAVFDYYVPFSTICEIYGIDRIAGADSVDALSEFGYSSIYDDRMYIFDKKTYKYFRVVGDSNNCFKALVSQIAAAESGSATYVTLAYIGGEIDNRTLCPISSFESDIYDVPYYQEDHPEQADRASSAVRGFFSDNFDFVRRIEEESGTVIYMYGYGRIVVIARSDGTLEFKMEDDERPAVQLKYLEAFERANAFIAVHGAFETKNGIPLVPYIKEVILNPDDKKGFRFIFGASINGSRIYYQAGAPVIVDVTGGKVTYYKRDMINVDAVELKSADDGAREVFSAINIVANNLEYIRSVLAKRRAIDNEGISFEALAEQIECFDYGYLRPDNNEGILEASWIVTISGIEFYFGLDDGYPRGYSSFRLRI